MLFKGFSYLELWQPFCSGEHYPLCYFSKEYYEDQFCEIILNLKQCFRRRCHIKDVLSGALAALLFCRAKPFVILKEGIMWNIYVKLYIKFGPVVQEEMPFKDISYLELW